MISGEVMKRENKSLITEILCRGKVLLARDRRWKVNAAAIDLGGFILLVDTLGTPAAGAELSDLVEGHFQSPVDAVVNTHHHYDHVLGNQVFAGGQLIAHRLVPEWMDTYEQKLADQVAGRESFKGFRLTRPNRLIKESLLLEKGKSAAHIVWKGPCHTNNDLMVLVEDYKLLITGDVFVPETIYPINLNSGGDLHNWVTVLDWITNSLEDFTIIGGHFGQAGKTEVSRQRDYLSSLLAVAGEHGNSDDKSYLEEAARELSKFDDMLNFNRYNKQNALTAREYITSRKAER